MDFISINEYYGQNNKKKGKRFLHGTQNSQLPSRITSTQQSKSALNQGKGKVKTNSKNTKQSCKVSSNENVKPVSVLQKNNSNQSPAVEENGDKGSSKKKRKSTTILQKDQFKRPHIKEKNHMNITEEPKSNESTSSPGPLKSPRDGVLGEKGPIKRARRYFELLKEGKSEETFKGHVRQGTSMEGGESTEGEGSRKDESKSASILQKKAGLLVQEEESESNINNKAQPIKETNNKSNRLWVGLKKVQADDSVIKALHPDIERIVWPRNKRGRKRWCLAYFANQEKALSALKVLKKLRDWNFYPAKPESDFAKNEPKVKKVKKVKKLKKLKKKATTDWLLLGKS